MSIKVTGRASHAGAAPEMGRNALYEMAHQVLQMRDLSKPQVGLKMNWTIASAGTNRNVIPAIAEAATMLGRPAVRAEALAALASEQNLTNKAILTQFLYRFAPNADPTLLPIVTLLNGIGFTMISRLDLAVGPGSRYARTQAVWIAIGIGVFVLALAAIRQVDTLRRYRYIFLVLGVGALLMPLVPGLGYTANGARLWIHLGPLNFQPGEAAKVLLVIFFAAYLADNRELLRSGTRRIGRMYVPAPRHFGPLLLPWATAVLIMVQQKDLGSSLLFFTVFVAMLYMATERSAYVIVGVVAFAAAAVIAYHAFAHVQLRVDTWLDPWKTAQSSGYQLVQSLFAFASGGVFGTGLGLGRPGIIPNAATDFVFSAIGEELGLIGGVALGGDGEGLCFGGGAAEGDGEILEPGFSDVTRWHEEIIHAQAQQVLGVDAAILFADLLPILEPMGINLEYQKGEGPVIHNPIHTGRDVDRLQSLDSMDSLDYVFQAVHMIRSSLPGDIPLIGFAGAPFTLASYCIEGGGSKNYVHT